MDGAGASETVSAYFRRLNPASWGFQVVRVQLGDDLLWTIDCELYPFIGADRPTQYHVEVNADGEIVEVERTGTAQRT